MRTMFEIIQFELNKDMNIITSLLKNPYHTDAVNLRPTLNRLPHQIGVEPSELLVSLYVYAPTTISVKVKGTPLYPWHPCGMPYKDHDTSTRGSRSPNRWNAYDSSQPFPTLFIACKIPLRRSEMTHKPSLLLMYCLIQSKNQLHMLLLSPSTMAKASGNN